MISDIVVFLICSSVIVAAGAALTQFGDALSHKTKLGGLLVGSILIAGATSLPELFINIHAVRMESANMAVGDLLGSCLLNLLYLAVLDMTRYSKGRMLSSKSSAHALPAGVSIVLIAIVGLFIFLGPRFNIVAISRVGLGSIVIFIAYILGTKLIFTGQKEGSDSSESKNYVYFIPGLKKMGLTGIIIGYIACAAAIVITAPFLARAAKGLAEQTGLGGTFFGTTFVAVCTSLPEMVTTFTAVRMRAFDLSLGNIFGSNCFNMALLFPLDFFSPEPILSSVSQVHIYTAFCLIITSMAVILGQLFNVERKKHFFEPDAVIVILLVITSLTGVYFLRSI